jgi:hypothetical protein
MKRTRFPEVAMTFTGHIQDGKVVFDDPVPLSEGTSVTVTPVSSGPAVQSPRVDAEQPARSELPAQVAAFLANPPPGLSPRALELIRLSWDEKAGAAGPNLYDCLKPLIDAAANIDLPVDASQRVDHYLQELTSR